MLTRRRLIEYWIKILKFGITQPGNLFISNDTIASSEEERLMLGMLFIIAYLTNLPKNLGMSHLLIHSMRFCNDNVSKWQKRSLEIPGL